MAVASINDLEESPHYPSLPEKVETSNEKLAFPKPNKVPKYTKPTYPPVLGRGSTGGFRNVLGEFSVQMVENTLDIVGGTMEQIASLFKPGLNQARNSEYPPSPFTTGASGTKGGFWATALGGGGSSEGTTVFDQRNALKLAKETSSLEDPLVPDRSEVALRDEGPEQIQLESENPAEAEAESPIPDQVGTLMPKDLSHYPILTEEEIELAADPGPQPLYPEIGRVADYSLGETEPSIPVARSMPIDTVLTQDHPLLGTEGSVSGDVVMRPARKVENYSEEIPGTRNKAGVPIRQKTREREDDLRADGKLVEKGDLSPAELIHHIGPDFMTNKFDAFWLWNPVQSLGEKSYEVEYGSGMRPDWATEYERHVVSHTGFAVRMGSLTYPASYNDSFEDTFLESKVSRLKSTKTQTNTSRFSLRLDQDLLWIDYLDILSGRLATYVEPMTDNSDMFSKARSQFFRTRLGFGTSNPDYRQLFTVIAKTWPWNSVGEKVRVSDYGLCLIVRMRQLGNYVNVKSQMKDLPFVVFENVRIAGTGDAISYKREGPNLQDISVEFIYRRSYVVMPEIGSDGLENKGLKSGWRYNLQNGVRDDGWYSQIEYLERDDVNEMFTRRATEAEVLVKPGILTGIESSVKQKQTERMA